MVVPNIATTRVRESPESSNFGTKAPTTTACQSIFTVKTTPI